MELPTTPQFKVAVSTGLFTVAHAPDLASLVDKIGYSMTRGTCAIEIAGDVAHEIDYTQGTRIRYIAEKQGLDLLFHGSLSIMPTMGERGIWTSTQVLMEKSAMSAVLGECKYVNFHSCQWYWPEMMTRGELKLYWIMVDEKGEHIKKKLKECPRLLEWFLEKYGLLFPREYILSREAETGLESKITKYWEMLEERKKKGEMTQEEKDEMVRVFKEREIREAIKQNILTEEEREWRDELLGDVKIIYDIMAHYILFTKNENPLWNDMCGMYRDAVGSVDDGNIMWLDERLEKAEKEGDDKFKEFYYGLVASKYLIGHTEKLLEFIKNVLPKRIDEMVDGLVDDSAKRREEKEKLKKAAENLIIAFETPDARSPDHAGRYTLWHPKQVYVTVKVARRLLKTNRIMALIDFEHIATQGVDPLFELEDLVKKAPDVGEYIICIHSNYPNPLHAHQPIYIGDTVIYKLLWTLRKAGLGKHHTTYILFERGGGEDPFQQSVTSLKIAVKFLEKDVQPNSLPAEFFGVATGEIASEERQLAAIRSHAYDPLKGLIARPEETHGLLGRAAIEEKRKRPEEWEKEKLR